MGSNQFSLLAPPNILKHDVECFILNEFTAEEAVSINVFSNGIPGIVFHHNDGRPAIESILLKHVGFLQFQVCRKAYTSGTFYQGELT
jgi:hypothetical protein